MATINPLDHLNLVWKLARKHEQRCREPVEDLFQVGYLGLDQAIKRYDPATGNRFSTFAYHWIDGEIRHYLRDEYGRREKNRIYRKPHASAVSFSKFDGLIDWQQYASTQDAEEWDAMQSVWLSSWELEPQQRDWLERYCIKGETQIDIAASVGVSVHTVMRRIQVAKSRLKKKYLEAIS